MLKHSLLPVVFLTAGTAIGQVTTNKLTEKKNADQLDSMRTSEYPYTLPIWGAKAYKAGYDLPYSVGIGVNYLWQSSDIAISDLSVGFNNGEMVNVDEIIRFNNATATSNVINVRPDIWLLPFLNVYAILAKGQNQTAVDFGIWVPDSTGNWKEVINAQTTADMTMETFGFGLTPTMGVGGYWMAFDMNFSWSDVSVLEKPAFVFNFDPRFGKTFRFKKESNLALWVGAFRLHLKSGTEGSIPLSDLFESSELDAKIATGYERVGDAAEGVDAWWAGLTPLEQANPLNEAKYNAANSALTAAGAVLDGMSGAVSTVESSSVQYSLVKKPKDMWNFLVGTQYQFNKHWMIRAEYGFLGSREQFIGGLQYRFGL